MSRTITELGPREAEFLATMAGSGKSAFTIEEAASFWGGGQYTRNVLSRLAAKGWLERIERGSYLIIPLEAGVERTWAEDPLALGTLLVPDGGAAHWTAARHWGWTTQLPRTVLFITPQRRFDPRPTIMGVDYRFVVLKPERVFGITDEWSGGFRLRVTDRERTILDVMDRPDLSGGIAEVSEMLRQAWVQLDLARLTAYLRCFGGGTPPKRLGFLAETLALPGAAEWLPQWRSLIGSGFTALERGGAPGGTLLRAWNLRLNASGFGGGSGR
jgi:predicted transcriptional regulator of viral defense system